MKVRSSGRKGHYADGGRVRDVDGTMIDPNGPVVMIDRRSPEKKRAEEEHSAKVREKQAQYESEQRFLKDIDGVGIIGALKKRAR